MPDLSLTKSDNESGQMLAGNQADFILAPGIASSGGPESNPLTVTDTLPAGMTPGTATSSSDWACTTVEPDGDLHVYAPARRSRPELPCLISRFR